MGCEKMSYFNIAAQTIENTVVTEYESVTKRSDAYQSEAELEKRKATEEVKREIVEVSGAIAEKMLEREINQQDHHALIESFIEKIGDGNDGNQ